MSDTPETDAKVSGHIGFYSCATVPAELCRRMERERDESQATLTDIHRWIERNHPDGFIDSLSFSQNLERVTDRWYERFDKLERERDEARVERDKVKDELMEWRPLCLWGGTPEYIHQFIKGQQARIHQTQNIETQLKEARESCEMWINLLREAREKIKRQAGRIRELEGATNHAGGLHK